MVFSRIISVFFMFIFSLHLSAYRVDVGESFLGGGFGANVNVVRYTEEKKATPGADMPLFINYEYAFLKDINLFSSFMPQFSAGSLTFLFRGGAKYLFDIFDGPYFPYVSLALVPTWRFSMAEAPTHFNLGLSPGAGLHFFVMSKLMVGAHIQMNPSVAFIENDRKFELSVTSYFDVTIKI